jgi:hypothetical protein
MRSMTDQNEFPDSLFSVTSFLVHQKDNDCCYYFIPIAGHRPHGASKGKKNVLDRPRKFGELSFFLICNKVDQRLVILKREARTTANAEL